MLGPEWSWALLLLSQQAPRETVSMGEETGPQVNQLQEALAPFCQLCWPV